MKVLVTGVAGGLARAAAPLLLARGAAVRGLVRNRSVDDETAKYIEIITGDLRDEHVAARAVRGVDAILHFAARTGFGAADHEYIGDNLDATVALLRAVEKTSGDVRTLVFASSSAVYGEGAYRCARCEVVSPPMRSAEQLERREWDPPCPRCGGALAPIPTPETIRPDNTHVYAVMKRSCEERIREFSAKTGVGAGVLRFPMLYGPHYATGIVPALVRQVLDGLPVRLTEDGMQTRDFLHVDDAARASIHALESQEHVGPLNVSASQHVSLVQLVGMVAESAGMDCDARAEGTFRAGDVRHICLDGSALAERGFRAPVLLKTGLREMIAVARATS